VYDSDCDPSNDVHVAIYSYILKEDYQNGLLEIVPEVVSHKLQLSLLLNLMNFLRLRADQHAQYEIRVYAELILEELKQIAPIATEAFIKQS